MAAETSYKDSEERRQKMASFNTSIEQTVNVRFIPSKYLGFGAKGADNMSSTCLTADGATSGASRLYLCTSG